MTKFRFAPYKTECIGCGDATTQTILLTNEYDNLVLCSQCAREIAEKFRWECR